MLQQLSYTLFNDAPQPWQLGFQDSAAPGFTGIVELHNTIFFYLVVIIVSVFWLIGTVMYYFNTVDYLKYFLFKVLFPPPYFIKKWFNL